MFSPAAAYSIGMIRIREEDNAVLLPVKVVPGASRTRCLGEWDGRARIAVAAPPESGKANKALLEFLARQLDIKRNALAIEAGTSSPIKTVRIDRVRPELVLAGLGLGPS